MGKFNKLDILIPAHKNCKNCGECCGPIPIDKKEFEEIKNYVNNNKPQYNPNPDLYTCKFLVDNKCTIYKVRPVICRLFGVVEGMECPEGNTTEIDGTPFINKSNVKGLLNDVIRTNY